MGRYSILIELVDGFSFCFFFLQSHFIRIMPVISSVLYSAIKERYLLCGAGVSCTVVLVCISYLHSAHSSLPYELE